MRANGVACSVLGLWMVWISCAGGAEPETPAGRKTAISVQGEKFFLNGRPTYEGKTFDGRSIEGMLFNSRMVQATFDDLNPETVANWKYPDTGKWDADRNVREFVAALPLWRKHGLLAVTLNLQGGSPFGYSKDQPWHNSALAEDGALRPEFMKRLTSVLEAADGAGMVVILGVYYFGQDQRLRDEAAVLAGIDNTVDYVIAGRFANVVLEINNECNLKYDHAVLKANRVHELILRARERAAANEFPLLAGTSYGGGTVPKSNVVKASDFILLHGNGVKEPKRIGEMVRQTRAVEGYRPMPIVFNEDDHFEFEKPNNNFRAAIAAGASWGYFDFRKKGEDFAEGYQSVPVDWGINSERKRGFFGLLSEITGEKP